VKERAGAPVVLSSPVFNATCRELATLTGRSRLPSIMAFPASLLARADEVIQR